MGSRKRHTTCGVTCLSITYPGVPQSCPDWGVRRDKGTPAWNRGSPLSWTGLPPTWDVGTLPPRDTEVPEGTWNQSLAYHPERTLDQWLEVLFDGDGVPPPRFNRQTLVNITSRRTACAYGNYILNVFNSRC